MPELDDHKLLAEFAGTNSEPAFATLIGRYVNLVYSAAFRFTGNPHHSEEITQAVFIILARKAGKLSPRVVLSGWLYQVARLTAANFMKGEIRRQRREQEAYMQSTLNEPHGDAWHEIAPLLDEAMGNLGETDRNAVVLRFFENKTAAEVAAKLNLTEAAAHKRVNRALQKLHCYFNRHGVSSATAMIAGAISANSVLAAPEALAKSITAVAIVKGATAGGSTLTLIKGALKIMAWTKVKTAVVAGVVIILAAGTTTAVVKHQHQIKDAIPGYATPDAAFQSSLLAMSKGDMKSLHANYTPEFQASFLETAGKGKSESELAAMFIQMASMIGDCQIVSNEVVASDEAVLHFRSNRIGNEKVPMKKIGSEWKINGNITPDAAGNDAR
ncbi:MAG TPA: sigma-70 family RNA polymerase sigma factor [Verrucomicrobiae bacterium]